MGLFGNLFGKRRAYDPQEDELRQPWDERTPWSTMDPSNFPGFPTQSAPREAPRRQGGGFGDKMTDIATALGAAGAFGSGDFTSGASIISSGNAAKLAAQKRMLDREDYLWQQQNKAPSPNDTERDWAFMKATLSPEEFETWRKNKIDPPQYRQGADGQFYRIDTGKSHSTPPSITMDDWNSGQPMGGGGGNATGNFRPRY